MKIGTSFVVLFFLAATSQAQTPSYRWYPNSQPYYPRVTIQPYYPEPYFPVPFGLPNFSQQDPLVTDQFAPSDNSAISNSAISNNNEANDALREQVQQLTDEVRSLQSELTASQERRVQTQESTEPVTPFVLVLKNGKRLESQGYAIVGDTLWILSPSGRERIAVSNLNIPATQKENLRRGITFPNLEN
jgi:hypothetical protein